MARATVTEEIKKRSIVKTNEELFKLIAPDNFIGCQFMVLNNQGILPIKGSDPIQYLGTFNKQEPVRELKQITKDSLMYFKLKERVITQPFDNASLRSMFLAQFQTANNALPITIIGVSNTDAIFGLGTKKKPFIGQVFTNYTVDMVRGSKVDGEVMYRYMIQLSPAHDKPMGFVPSDLKLVLTPIPVGYKIPKDKTIRSGDQVMVKKTKQILTVTSVQRNPFFDQVREINGENIVLFCTDDKGVIVKVSAALIKKV